MSDITDYPALVELASRLKGKDKKTCDLALYCLKKQDKRISKLHAQIAELEGKLDYCASQGAQASADWLHQAARIAKLEAALGMMDEDDG